MHKKPQRRKENKPKRVENCNCYGRRNWVERKVAKEKPEKVG